MLPSMLVAWLSLLVGCHAQNIVEIDSSISFYHNKTFELIESVWLNPLSMYQDLDNYEKNLTIRSNGTTLNDLVQKEDIRLCYIEDTKGQNYDAFIRECRDSKNSTNKTLWVLVSNAMSNENDNIDVMKSAADFDTSKVVALIMLSNVYPRELDSSKPDEQNKFVNPAFLGITNAKKHQDTFKKYSWN